MAMTCPCKFTPLGFETDLRIAFVVRIALSVNLPRWGLKLYAIFNIVFFLRCKFTPLGFETASKSCFLISTLRVNLPRWGLKPAKIGGEKIAAYFGVNLPRWGLKPAKRQSLSIRAG